MARDWRYEAVVVIRLDRSPTCSLNGLLKK